MASAQAGPILELPGPVGVGLILGLPTGASAKLELHEARHHALDLSVGSPGVDRVWIQMGYAASVPVVRSAPATLSLSLGAGGLFQADPQALVGPAETRPRMAARLPVGVELWLPQFGLELFAEAGPIGFFGPWTVNYAANGGARYFF